MAAQMILFVCAQALLLQVAFSQCLGSAAIDASRYAPYGLPNRGWAYDGLAYDGLIAPHTITNRLGYDNLGFGCAPAVEITPTTGGGLVVSSASAIPPVGVSVASENMYEGILAAAGEVPFVGTVGVEGVLPTAGAGAVNYGCGNGVTAMTASDLIAPAIVTPAIGAFAPAAAIGAPAAVVGTPAAAIGAPAFGYAGWAGRGCGCGI